MTRRTRRFAAGRSLEVRGTVPTVASLGLRVRLDPSRAELDQEITDLIAAYERLRRDHEALFQRVIAVLKASDRRSA
jgi:hypothetical protein